MPASEVNTHSHACEYLVRHVSGRLKFNAGGRTLWSMKARIIIVTAVLALIAAGVVLWPSVHEFLAVDTCLDRSGSYDYVNHRCDHERSHPHGNSLTHVPPEEDSRGVMAAALLHLDHHLRAKWKQQDDVLLLDPTSDVWSMESLRSFSSDPENNCVITDEMYKRVAAAALQKEPIANFVSPSPRWLIPAELPQPDPLVPVSDFNGVPISTVVTLSRPGFSLDGNQAVVILSFTWSIHDALARVRLQRDGTEWKIRCAQFDYYV